MPPQAGQGGFMPVPFARVWLLFLILPVTLIGCSKPMIYRLDTTITSPAQAQADSFEDDLIAVSFQMTHHAIHMTLKNKTHHPLKILWTQSNFIDLEGQPQGITHTKFRSPPRGVVHTPSVSSVPPGGELMDTIIPFKRLGPETAPRPSEPFFEGLEVGPGRWPEEQLRKAYVGKTFALVLTIETDRITPYRFRFRINDFKRVESE
jgi:hypothetical protein